VVRLVRCGGGGACGGVLCEEWLPPNSLLRFGDAACVWLPRFPTSPAARQGLGHNDVQAVFDVV